MATHKEGETPEHPIAGRPDRPDLPGGPAVAPPIAEPPVVEYPKWVKRLDDKGAVTDEVLVETEEDEKKVKANWAKEGKPDKEKTAKEKADDAREAAKEKADDAREAREKAKEEHG
jgi:hypothetical protein